MEVSESNVAKRFSGMEENINKLDNRFSGMDENINKLDNKLNNRLADMDQMLRQILDNSNKS